MESIQLHWIDGFQTRLFRHQATLNSFPCWQSKTNKIHYWVKPYHLIQENWRLLFLEPLSLFLVETCQSPRGIWKGKMHQIAKNNRVYPVGFFRIQRQFPFDLVCRRSLSRNMCILYPCRLLFFWYVCTWSTLGFQVKMSDSLHLILVNNRSSHVTKRI